MNIFKSAYRELMSQRNSLGHYGRQLPTKWEYFWRVYKAYPRLLLEEFVFSIILKLNLLHPQRYTFKRIRDDITSLRYYRFRQAVQVAYFKHPEAPNAITCAEFRMKYLDPSFLAKRGFHETYERAEAE